jgi:hypothetical protein
MNLIKDLIASADGSASSMRVGMLIVIAGIVFEHVWATIHSTPMAWDWQQVLAIVGSLGAKATQRAFEGAPTQPAVVQQPKP